MNFSFAIRINCHCPISISYSVYSNGHKQCTGRKYSQSLSLLLELIRQLREIPPLLDPGAILLFWHPFQLSSRHHLSLSCALGETTSFAYLNSEETLSSNVSKIGRLTAALDATAFSG